MEELIFSPSDFVAVLNQTLEYAYPGLLIQGEIANLRISKNRWVYFDLRDDGASVKFFGTVQQLPGPLEDGMLLQVRGVPRLHNLYGFSVNVQFMQPVGEGSIRKAAAMLEAKLSLEGLFDDSRKRPLPYLPVHVGLITSGESAAYRDFIKIINERWGGVSITLANVQVQGEPAVGQVVRAIEHFNESASPPEVLIITRGGGSPEDLSAFSSEQVTRAVAGSRIPTLVAIGHEVDVSLAEMAADRRASTPSNAAQMLVPDRLQTLAALQVSERQLGQLFQSLATADRQRIGQIATDLQFHVLRQLEQLRTQWHLRSELLSALSPSAALKRGYAVVRLNGQALRRSRDVRLGDDLAIELQQGKLSVTVKGKS